MEKNTQERTPRTRDVTPAYAQVTSSDDCSEFDDDDDDGSLASVASHVMVIHDAENGLVFSTTDDVTLASSLCSSLTVSSMTVPSDVSGVFDTDATTGGGKLKQQTQPSRQKVYQRKARQPRNSKSTAHSSTGCACNEMCMCMSRQDMTEEKRRAAQQARSGSAHSSVTSLGSAITPLSTGQTGDRETLAALLHDVEILQDPYRFITIADIDQHQQQQQDSSRDITQCNIAGSYQRSARQQQQQQH
eukprot:scpid84244/ scgid31143/ 